jgi:hypothetical protein
MFELNATQVEDGARPDPSPGELCLVKQGASRSRGAVTLCSRVPVLLWTDVGRLLFATSTAFRVGISEGTGA